MRARLVLAGAGGLLLALPAAPAFAHAELGSATPRADSKLAAVPAELRLTFSERPSADSQVLVSDGCQRLVDGPASVSGHVLAVPVIGGRAGTWRVDYEVISADDGHFSSGGYGFTVAGTTDCTSPVPRAVAVEPVDVTGGGSGSGRLVLPGLLGAGALLGASLVVRRRTALASAAR